MHIHRRITLSILFLFVRLAQASAMDQLIETAKDPKGDSIPYLLTTEGSDPKYAVILMPGGSGQLEPHLENGQVVFKASGNFLIRSRGVFADEEFAAASTDATNNPERMGAILDDLSRRYPGVKIYIVGTSRSTLSTMDLSAPLDGKVVGFIHTSSMGDIASFNTQNFRSRHLIVHHKWDGCRQTLYQWAELNHKKFGTALITMEGGVSRGDSCQAFAYHGYNGLEKQTVDKIKAWIKADTDS